MVDLKQLMFDKGLKQSDIASILDISQSLVSKMIRGERGMPEYYIDALNSHFGSDVIKKYTIPDTPFTPIKQEATITIYNKETVEEMRGGITEEVRAEEIKTTLVLPPDVVRNPDINIKKDIKAGKLKKYVKPVQDILPNDTIKVYTYCDDMDPEIRAGEPVLVQLLPSDLPINPGQMYFIDLRSGGIIRYIEQEKDGKLYLKARNSSYGDMVVDRKDVQSLSIVRLILRSPRSMNYKESMLAEMIERKDEHLSSMMATNSKLIEELCKRNERSDKILDELLKK
jgi:transcriptional regulator with XRE-family HTH domain